MQYTSLIPFHTNLEDREGCACHRSCLGLRFGRLSQAVGVLLEVIFEKTRRPHLIDHVHGHLGVDGGVGDIKTTRVAAGTQVGIVPTGGEGCCKEWGHSQSNIGEGTDFSKAFILVLSHYQQEALPSF